VPRFKFSEIVNNVRESRAPTPADEASYIGLEHLDSGSLFVSRWGSDVPLKGHKLQMKKGDLLFGKRNAYLRRAAIAPHDGLFSAHGMVFRPNVKVVDKRLFPFFVGSDAVFDAAIRISVGSLSPTVNWRDLAELEFELPPLEVQPVIAEKLWAANETRESYKRLLSIIDDLVKSQFVEMFGEISFNSYCMDFTDAFEIRDDLRKPISDAVRSSMRTGTLFPYYGVNGQVDRINEYLMDCDAICLAEDCGSYGPDEPSSYIVHGKCWVNNHVHVLIPKECCDIIFANEYFRILDMSEYASGTTRSKLTQAKMKTIPMMIPPLPLQRRFAAFVAAADKSKFAVRKSLEKLDAVYKALSKEAFG